MMLIGLFEAVVLVLLVGFGPFLAGAFVTLTVVKRLRLNPSLLASLVAGILVFLFVDLFEGSGGLGIDLGLSGSIQQALLLAFFTVGLLGLLALDRTDQNVYGKSILLVYVFAISLSLHSLAEGIVAGYDLSKGLEASLAYALQASSFAIHKFMEGTAIGAAYLFTSGRRPITLLPPTLIVGMFVSVGVVYGFIGLPAILSSYFFAAGAATTLYLLVKTIMLAREGLATRKMMVWMLLGILLMYLAGTLHTTRI